MTINMNPSILQFHQSPAFSTSMRLNLKREDESGTLDIAIFDKQAEKLTGTHIMSMSNDQHLSRFELPDKVKRVINKEFYFTVGFSQKAVTYSLKVFKVYDNKPVEEPAEANSDAKTLGGSATQESNQVLIEHVDGEDEGVRLGDPDDGTRSEVNGKRILEGSPLKRLKID